MTRTALRPRPPRSVKLKPRPRSVPPEVERWAGSLADAIMRIWAGWVATGGPVTKQDEAADEAYLGVYVDAAQEEGAVAGFTVVSPAAVAFAQTRSAQLIVNLTAQQRKTVRYVITQAESAKLPQGQATKIIRATVGLTEQQGRAVTNYMLGLYDAQLKDWTAAQVAGRWSLSPWRGGALDDAKIDRLVTQYGDRMRRYRAETIARTEMMNAKNQGRMETWGQMADQKLISSAAEVRWVVGDDDRTCKDCLEMDDTTRALDGTFDTPDGALDGPPLHPDCRCTIVLVTNP